MIWPCQFFVPSTQRTLEFEKVWRMNERTNIQTNILMYRVGRCAQIRWLFAPQWTEWLLAQLYRRPCGACGGVSGVNVRLRTELPPSTPSASPATPWSGSPPCWPSPSWQLHFTRLQVWPQNFLSIFGKSYLIRLQKIINGNASRIFYQASNDQTYYYNSFQGLPVNQETDGGPQEILEEYREKKHYNGGTKSLAGTGPVNILVVQTHWLSREP